ncbi:hypothetical protein EJB05_09919 [Eragrostis curvula]|uniref:Phytocyanin domain-containing protein n=1 Tax=Eragrostis curvula TaxID=38414 RepID=A0A5J9W665_9POAL|nr:hypothetical protein EJB05_09919 [Eragrostis curvula]
MLRMAHGGSCTVGAPAGSWDLRSNYTTWASSINFRARDQLGFKYSRSIHNTGDDTITLTADGVTRYFICGVPGHCDAGMKLAVRVEAGATAGPNAAAPSPMPVAMAPRAAGPPMGTPTAGGRRPGLPPSSSAASAGSVGSLVGVGLAAIVAGLLTFY